MTRIIVKVTVLSTLMVMVPMLVPTSILSGILGLILVGLCRYRRVGYEKT